MKFNLITYNTLSGKEEIIEVKNERSSQCVIYQDDKPTFYVNCYDLETEANVLMNNLVLCQSRKIGDVIKDIGKKNKVDISIKKAPLFSFKTTVETIELDLPPLPEEWLN